MVGATTVLSTLLVTRGSDAASIPVPTSPNWVSLRTLREAVTSTTDLKKTTPRLQPDLREERGVFLSLRPLAARLLAAVNRIARRQKSAHMFACSGHR